MTDHTARLAPNFTSIYREGKSSTDIQALRRLKTAAGVNRKRRRNMARVAIDIFVSGALAFAATISTLPRVRPKSPLHRG